MKADQIREKFLKFFEERGHKIYPSDSLVPRNDPTLLFTGAGMNQFKEEFMGKVKGTRRAATSQKCLRTGDLENVGKTSGHHTFFEMLGNFSFGDYFKKDAIIWAWEFLTKELGLKEEDLWVSVYKDDAEAYDIWKKVIKLPVKKILKFGEKDNFWPSEALAKGPNGPCGPCSEIFYGGPDGVEVWNLVFTQFDRKEGGGLAPLPNKNIDTGMGLERIAMVMQGKKTNFEIDSFQPITKAINGLIKNRGVGGNGCSPLHPYFYAIADHIRAVTFAIGDGVLPSNEERGYVIRKLIRKAFWYGRSFGLEDPFLYKIVPVVAKVMEIPYPELTQQREDIAQVVIVEEKRFTNTLREGLEKLRSLIKEKGKDSKSVPILSGEDIFKLYDTYGFPMELTKELADKENIKIDIKEFETFMKKQRAKSRGSSQIKDSIFGDNSSVSDGESMFSEETSFIEKDEVKTTIIRIVKDKRIVDSVGNGEDVSIILKETSFYGEKGGQAGDTGVLIKDGKEAADVLDAIDVAGRIYHKAKVKLSYLKTGDTVIARIDTTRRERIKKNHTATHLLHSVLRKVLGQHVKQAGSLVAPDRLRFDFTHFKALTDEEVSRVERLVNEYINAGNRVLIKEMSFDEAKGHGAIALFGEKYGDRVRMVCAGDDSKELCGGTHVNNTNDIKLFKIISEGSIASGIRRIEAVTGEAASAEIKKKNDMLALIAEEFDATPDNLSKKIEKALNRFKGVEKAFEGKTAKLVNAVAARLLDKKEYINGIEILISEVKTVDMMLLRKISDAVKSKLQKGIFFFVSEKDGKIASISGVCGDINGKSVDASKLLNEIGADFGMKGGGRPDFAQAGGTRGKEIEAILKKSRGVIKKYL